MRRTFYQLAALSSVALAACADSGRLSGPLASDGAPPAPSFSISDAAHQGAAGFYFLAPLVAEPRDTGTFDPNRSVSVTVCPLGNPAASSCTGAAVTVSPAAPSSVDVHGNHYQVNWQTDPAAFQADSYYRISVVDNITHGVYGHVDVFLGSTGRGFHSIDQSEFTPLLDGRTVPIKFRIDGGASAPGTGGGSTGGTTDSTKTPPPPPPPDTTGGTGGGLPSGGGTNS